VASSSEESRVDRPDRCEGPGLPVKARRIWVKGEAAVVSSSEESRVDRHDRREGPGLSVKAGRIWATARREAASAASESTGDESRLDRRWPGTCVSFPFAEIGMAAARVWWLRLAAGKREGVATGVRSLLSLIFYCN
jgi:hypothetical protein